MKLRKECEHGRYETHWLLVQDGSTCPGGVFLPDDTLVIEKVDGKWPKWAIRAVYSKWGAEDTLDALSVREAE